VSEREERGEQSVSVKAVAAGPERLPKVANKIRGVREI
jgi:hypothetical protein